MNCFQSFSSKGKIYIYKYLSHTCTKITTHQDYEGYGPDKAPDEMVINPQPASTEGGKKVIFSSLNHLIAKTKLCLIDQGRAELAG